MNFQPESGYDAAINALQNLGLPIRDKSQPAIHPTSAAPRLSQHHPHVLPPPPPIRLLPSPELSYRPNTSNGFEYRPSSSAPEIQPERPWTAPDPVSFSQTLPPRRELPLTMQRSLNQKRPPTRMWPPSPHSRIDILPDSRHRVPLSIPPTSSPDPLQQSQMLPPVRKPPPRRQVKAGAPEVTSQPFNDTPEGSRPDISEPTQPVPKPPAKRKPRAKPKAAKNPAIIRMQESQGIEHSIPNTPIGEASKETLQPALSAPQGPKKRNSRAKGVVSNTLATNAEKPMLDLNTILVASESNAQVSTTRPNSTSAPPRNGHASDVVTAERPAERSTTAHKVANSSTQTSEREGLLVLRPGRKAMTEVLGNSSGRRPASPNTTSTSKEPASKYPSVAGASEVSPEEFMSQLHNFVRDFQHLPAPTPRPTDSEQLAAYAAQPDEVRQAVIKDMIFEYLGDENFIKLAEDVEKEWRRVGLGF